MTANKRFTIFQDSYDTIYIKDKEVFRGNGLRIGNEEDVKYKNVLKVVDCLNELYEENKKLKQDIIQIEKVSDKRYYDNQRLKTRLKEKDRLLQKTLKTNETLQKALQKQYEEFDEK